MESILYTEMAFIIKDKFSSIINKLEISGFNHLKYLKDKTFKPCIQWKEK